MKQIQLILNRLRKPSVIISIISQLATILILCGVDIDKNLTTTIITAICSILTLLGILSDPESQNKGFSDTILICSHCNKASRHVYVNGKYICAECGCEYINIIA